MPPLRLLHLRLLVLELLLRGRGGGVCEDGALLSCVGLRLRGGDALRSLLLFVLSLPLGGVGLRFCGRPIAGRWLRWL